MGPGCTVGDGGNVSKDVTGYKSREFQYHGLHTRVHMWGSGGEHVYKIRERGEGATFR